MIPAVNLGQSHAKKSISMMEISLVIEVGEIKKAYI